MHELSHILFYDKNKKDISRCCQRIFIQPAKHLCYNKNVTDRHTNSLDKSYVFSYPAILNLPVVIIVASEQ